MDPKTVNDKDGISAAIYLAQIASELKSQGFTLLDLLAQIWERHGFHGTEQISIRVESTSEITKVLKQLRQTHRQEIAGRKVISIDDMSAPTDGLPATDGLRIWLDGAIRVIVRPSGTEAKMKCYIEVITKDASAAEKLLAELRVPLKELLK